MLVSSERICLIYCAPTWTVLWPPLFNLGHREIGGVVHGRHTITLFRRPRTVHLEACSIVPFSSRPFADCAGRARLMAQLSTGDGRPMGRPDRLAVHDRGFRSLTRKIGHHHVAINPSMATRNYSATSNNRKLVHWLLTGGLLHLVQRRGNCAGPQPAQAPPRCTKCNNSPINGPVYQSPYCCIIVQCSAVLR